MVFNLVPMAHDSSRAVAPMWRGPALVTWLIVALLTPKAASGQTWGVQETLRIGGSDDPGDAIFGRISAATFDPAGRIIVGDAQSHDVRVFSHAGRLERTLGRRGRGPGEFERPGAMGFVGGRLWVSDGALRRVVFFDADGRPDSTTGIRYTPPAGFGGDAPVAMAADGSAIVKPSVAAERTANGPVGLPIVRVGADRTVDTIHVEQLPPLGRRMEMGGRQVVVRRPLAPTPKSDVAADGSLVAAVDQAGPAGNAPTFRLVVKDGRGRTLGQRLVPYTPLRVPTAYADSVRETIMRLPPGAPAAQQQLARTLADALEFPSHYPAVERVLVGGDATVWVRLAGPGPTAQWRVFDARANPIGALQLPAGMEILYASRVRMLATGLNTDDEPVLVRYDVTARATR